jgi:hypothetical protein
MGAAAAFPSEFSPRALLNETTTLLLCPFIPFNRETGVASFQMFSLSSMIKVICHFKIISWDGTKMQAAPSTFRRVPKSALFLPFGEMKCGTAGSISFSKKLMLNKRRHK